VLPVVCSAWLLLISEPLTVVVPEFSIAAPPLLDAVLFRKSVPSKDAGALSPT
jgi:hypothetical protein